MKIVVIIHVSFDTRVSLRMSLEAQTSLRFEVQKSVRTCHLKLGHEPKRHYIAMRMLMVLLPSYFLSSLAAIMYVAVLTLQLIVLLRRQLEAST